MDNFTMIIGMIVLYAVLPALLIATIIKMRSLKLTIALLVLIVSAFVLGLNFGIKMQKRKYRREQHKIEIEEKHQAEKAPLTKI